MAKIKYLIMIILISVAVFTIPNISNASDVNVTKKHYADISEEIKKEACKQVSIRENPTKFDE